MIQHENDAHLKKMIDQLTGLPENTTWNVDKGWNDYNSKHHKKKNLHLAASLLAAAMVVIAVILTTTIFQKNDRLEKQVVLTTNDHEKKQIELWEGSKIWLNNNTSIEADKELRQIRMQGEAWFEMTGKDSFTIVTPHGKFITGSGTFNLKTKKEELKAICTVEKGEVTMIWENGSDQYTTAQAGTEATIIPGIAVITAPSEDPNYLAWKTGELHFNNTPMYCVAEKLEELNNSTIEFVNKDMRYCRVNSDFKTLSIQTILQELTSQIDYTIENAGNIYRITGEGCTI